MTKPRTIAALSVALALSIGPAHAAVTVKWVNYIVPGFITAVNTWAIGSSASHPNGSCGTISAGDFLVVREFSSSNGGADPGAQSTPSGFNALFTPILGSGGDTRAAFFWKIATGAESCTTGFTSSWTNVPVTQTWSISDYGGVDNVSPIDSHNETVAGFTGAATMVAPSTTAVNAAAFLIGWANDFGAHNPYGIPAGMTLALDTEGTAGTAGNEEAYLQLGSAGATGAKTFTNTGGNGTWSAGLVTLLPAGAPPPSTGNQGMLLRGAQ